MGSDGGGCGIESRVDKGAGFGLYPRSAMRGIMNHQNCKVQARGSGGDGGGCDIESRVDKGKDQVQ